MWPFKKKVKAMKIGKKIFYICDWRDNNELIIRGEIISIQYEENSEKVIATKYRIKALDIAMIELSTINTELMSLSCIELRRREAENRLISEDDLYLTKQDCINAFHFLKAREHNELLRQVIYINNSIQRELYFMKNTKSITKM